MKSIIIFFVLIYWLPKYNYSQNRPVNVVTFTLQDVSNPRHNFNQYLPESIFYFINSIKKSAHSTGMHQYVDSPYESNMNKIGIDSSFLNCIDFVDTIMDYKPSSQHFYYVLNFRPLYSLQVTSPFLKGIFFTNTKGKKWPKSADKLKVNDTIMLTATVIQKSITYSFVIRDIVNNVDEIKNLDFDKIEFKEGDFYGFNPTQVAAYKKLSQNRLKSFVGDITFKINFISCIK